MTRYGCRRQPTCADKRSPARDGREPETGVSHGRFARYRFGTAAIQKPWKHETHQKRAPHMVEANTRSSIPCEFGLQPEGQGFETPRLHRTTKASRRNGRGRKPLPLSRRGHKYSPLARCAAKRRILRPRDGPVRAPSGPLVAGSPGIPSSKGVDSRSSMPGEPPPLAGPPPAGGGPRLRAAAPWASVPAPERIPRIGAGVPPPAGARADLSIRLR
jgi:hypothetical protein